METLNNVKLMLEQEGEIEQSVFERLEELKKNSVTLYQKEVALINVLGVIAKEE